MDPTSERDELHLDEAASLERRALFSGGRRLSIHFDTAVAIALAARFWQSAAGLITLFVVIRFFSPLVQGFFQTFLSLLALQIFFELGLLAVIVVAVSHEWSGLAIGSDGQLEGPEEKRGRLASIARFVAFWFTGAGGLLLVGGGTAGYLILKRGGDPQLWLWPWAISVAMAALLLVAQGFVAILEGANRLVEVATFRLVQSVIASTALWAAAAAGWDLWSLPAQLAASVLCAVVFIAGLRGRYFWAILTHPKSPAFNWRSEIWPMQWQLALQGVAGYFTFSLIVPVVFTFQGAVEAGRMGLSMQLMLALMAFPATWLNVALPRLGASFAGGDIEAFERQWRHAVTSSTIFFVVVFGATATILSWARYAGLEAAERLVTTEVFLVLAMWAAALHMVQCCAAYWRAQKVEMLGFWGLLPGAVTGLAVVILAKHFGVLGAAVAAASVAGLIFLPLCVQFLWQSRSRLSLTR